MAIKGAKTGDKRKATASAGKPAEINKKPVVKHNNASESTRKMWRNDEASDDSSDDDDDGGGSFSDAAEDGGAALPAKKKAKQAKDDGDADKNAGKKVEKSTCHPKKTDIAAALIY